MKEDCPHPARGSRGPTLPRPRTPPLLGIVIPTLNEEENLPRLLEELARLSLPFEVVVADGGSTDHTRQAAKEFGARVRDAPRGRARQMNAGAAVTETPWLLFLHADVTIPAQTLEALESWLANAGPRDFATFSFALEGNHWFWRFIELGQGIRERISGLAYGDQGLLVSRTLFQEARGFPDLPLMEDVEILRLLKEKGRWKKITEPILTNPRRYQEEGHWWSWLRNTALITLYLAGVSPKKLARFYPSRGKTEGAPPERLSISDPLPTKSSTQPYPRGLRRERTLLIFAKAPVPGRVKTRLAADVGHEEATRIYKEMGGRIVDQLRGGPYRAFVCFDPPDARTAIVEWLGPEGIEFLPQAPGELGERLETAFREAFRTAREVVVVGTDAPGVDAEVVGGAFHRLSEADLVLGPATDGGYYLLGLREEVPELFRGIPWSTDLVLAATMERAEVRGLAVATLPTLSDVDTLTDLRAFDAWNTDYP